MSRIDVFVRDELYNLIAEEAEREGLSLGEVLSQCFADRVGKPELGLRDKQKPGPKPRVRPIPA